MAESRAGGDVRKGAVTVVVIKVVDGLGPLGKSVQSAPAQDEEVRIAITVVVEGRDAAPCALPDVLFRLLTPVYHADGQPGLRGNVHKLNLRRLCLRTGLRSPDRRSQQQGTNSGAG